MTLNIAVPPPRRGGTRIFCPMVDMAEMEANSPDPELIMCQWAGRNTRNDWRRYRQHWRRDHLAPFLAETHAMMSYLVTGNWLGYKGVLATVKVYK